MRKDEKKDEKCSCVACDECGYDFPSTCIVRVGERNLCNYHADLAKEKGQIKKQ